MAIHSLIYCRGMWEIDLLSSLPVFFRDAVSHMPNGFSLSTPIFSFQVNKALHTSIVEVNRKRKLQAEQLGLPLPKHKCSDQSLLSNPAAAFDENGEIEDTHINRKVERGTIDDGSETESAKDSNSFVGDYDSVMFGDVEGKHEIGEAKPWSYSGPSSSSLTLGRKDEITCLGEEHDPLHHYNELQASQNLKEPMVAFGSHFEYIYSQLANDTTHQYSEKELDDVLYSNEPNPNTYVLSSGRWSVSQESQARAKKPTIDQEFEQYFSMLML